MKKQKNKSFKSLSGIFSAIILGVTIGFFLQLAQAWKEPGDEPPSSNIGAPITTGSQPQGKSGFLGVGALTASTGGYVKSPTFNYYSDQRLKENISGLNSSLDKVSQLRGVEFQWKDQKQNKGNKAQIGLIAQEVESVYPELVNTGSDGMKSVEYGNLVAPLIESVKELKTQNQELNQKLQNQQEQINNLYQQINAKNN
ncbi:MAG: tail fiber domain-containing protein [Patescibacteria group bacterium]